ncbi:MAG: GTPase Era, partial [Gammaproteobacteria bacterium]|nr:GTPase Era [Gammaproteobacteria bacterium]
LLNAILGQKISITSQRPQTTRHRILGIKTEEQTQYIYVDTPGMHKAQKREMNKMMNKAATNALRDVDAVLFVVEGTRWTEEDEIVAKNIEHLTIPVMLVVNKVDLVVPRENLLPHIQTLQQRFPQHQVVLLSAKQKDGVHDLEQQVLVHLPESEHFYFPDDQVTDKSQRFMVAELIREKLTRELGQELPYELTVEIEQFEVKEKIINIAAIIWVEREGQKAILIGKGGERLKRIGKHARLDMEKVLSRKVFLQLWVRVKSGWSNDIRALKSLGYDNGESD